MDGNAGDEYIKHVGEIGRAQNFYDGEINQNLMLKIDKDEWMEMREINISSMLEIEG